MSKDYITENQGLGMNQGTTIEFHSIYKVAEASPRGLVTTSGRLGVTTLTDTINLIIANYSNRPCDWLVTLNGVIVAQIHVDDSVTLP